jgi:NDP-sugar pyrophosphorylase family protein
MKNKISITINSKTLYQIKSTIDGIKIRSLSQAIEYLIEKALIDNRSAVILTAPARIKKNQLPENRATIEINGKPIIEHAIKKLYENKFSNIFIVGNHKILSEIYEKIGDGSKYSVQLTYVEEELSGGLGLKNLKNVLHNPFLCIFCDVIFNEFDIEELWNQHIHSKAISTLLMNTLPPQYLHNELVAKVKGRQIIEFEYSNNSKTPPYFTGIFVAEPEILKNNCDFKDLFQTLSKTQVLNAYIESVPYYHIHTKKESKKINLKKLLF